MAALNKIAATSPSRQRPSELESSIANALYDLESNIPDMKTALRPLQFVSAREVRQYRDGALLVSSLDPSCLGQGLRHISLPAVPGSCQQQRRRQSLGSRYSTIRLRGRGCAVA